VNDMLNFALSKTLSRNYGKSGYNSTSIISQIFTGQMLFLTFNQQYQSIHTTLIYKSSAVAEMGDRSHNRHGPKRGGCCAPFAQHLI